MNNISTTSAKTELKNNFTSYLRNFMTAQKNLELNRQEDYLFQLMARNSEPAKIKKDFTKEV